VPQWQDGKTSKQNCGECSEEDSENKSKVESEKVAGCVVHGEMTKPPFRGVGG